MTADGAPGTGEGLRARPGTPRSQRVHEAAVDATRRLLAEGGLPAATMDAIAARSGVSKATLYKHWPSRTAVAAEAFGREMADAVPLPDTGTTVGDLTEQVRLVSRFYASPEGTVFAQLLAACVHRRGRRGVLPGLVPGRPPPRRRRTVGAGSGRGDVAPASTPTPPPTCCSARWCSG